MNTAWAVNPSSPPWKSPWAPAKHGGCRSSQGEPQLFPRPGMVVMATLKDVQRRLPVMPTICSWLVQACLRPYNNRGMWLLPQTSSCSQTHLIHCRTMQERPFQSLLLCPADYNITCQIFIWRLGKNSTSSQNYWSKTEKQSSNLSWLHLRTNFFSPARKTGRCPGDSSARASNILVGNPQPAVLPQHTGMCSHMGHRACLEVRAGKSNTNPHSSTYTIA